jgi:hypothetical protein
LPGRLSPFESRAARGLRGRGDRGLVGVVENAVVQKLAGPTGTTKAARFVYAVVEVAT